MKRTILILAANPKDTGRLRLDEEVREIENELDRARKRFALKVKLAPRLNDVHRAMLDHEPSIVHFCGHGAGEKGIAFEDGNGTAELINTDALATLFELFSFHIECVVLNACYTKVQAEAIARHIPYVIGMKKEIGDVAAIRFAVAFYDALGAGKNIEFAYKLGCNAIQSLNIPEHLTPVLEMRPIEKIFWQSALRAAATVVGTVIDPFSVNPTTLITSMSDVLKAQKGKKSSTLSCNLPGGRDLYDSTISGEISSIGAASSTAESASAQQARFVTNLEFLEFVRSSGHPRPRHWGSAKPCFAEDDEDAPVTGVSWDDATAYCDWMGGCLPGKDSSPIRVQEIGEWRNAGNELRKSVWNPSRSLEVLDRKTLRPNVGFRCIPVHRSQPTGSVRISGGRYEFGTDVKKFSRLSEIHRLTAAQSRPILGRPAASYNILDFTIFITCVTNEEYFEFTRASGKKWPTHWDAKWFPRSDRPFPARLASQPVVNVTGEDAQRYCIWSQTRLPSWLEWERAASGQLRNPYPWGMEYSPDCCNGLESGCGSLVTVDEHQVGDSPEGVRQLCGNVAEWVIGPQGQFELRGGSYRLPCEIWGLAHAFREVEVGFLDSDVGFRVVTG